MDQMTPLAVVAPGLLNYLLTSLLVFSPLIALLVARLIIPAQFERMPPQLRGGVGLALGLAGTFISVLAISIIGTNGASYNDEVLQVRASRIFVVQVERERLDLDAAAPIERDSLAREGGLRVPGYRAGAWRDASGRRLFVLDGGGTLTRIPVRGDYDLAISLRDPEQALERLRTTR